ncbi:hypothetical protein ACFOOK_11820 [Micromonospora krabiensis]|uniref:hypothetical protein n=1 Tax=Micromonospora krabiensis TaxID=307121 RepID=UPI000B85DD7B|nr:hypothetical protein [Micromonospora krabiensis]
MAVLPVARGRSGNEEGSAMQVQRSAPPIEDGLTGDDPQVAGGTTGASTPLAVWAASALQGRIGLDEDDVEDERHILRGFE